MSNEQISTAVTGIHNAEFESFSASTLFGQGWSVLHRALDWNSLQKFIEEASVIPDVLLLSTDLEGLDGKTLESYRKLGIKVFLFRGKNQSAEDFPNTTTIPETSLELIGLIRGSIRAPLVRLATKENSHTRAHVLAVGGAHNASGCTSLSINLASELALTGKKTLLVDAHSMAPSVAILLGQQGLQSAKGFQQMTAGFWAIEVTRHNVVESIELMGEALFEFDLIIIDLGPVTDLAESLGGRRWGAEVLVWSSTHADDLWLLSKSDRLAIERLRRLVLELGKNSIKPHLSFVQSFTAQGKRGGLQDQAFLSVVTPLRPKQLLRYPLDVRSIVEAENNQETLYESNEKSLLRKSVHQLSGEIGL